MVNSSVLWDLKLEFIPKGYKVMEVLLHLTYLQSETFWFFFFSSHNRANSTKVMVRDSLEHEILKKNNDKQVEVTIEYDSLTFTLFSE